MAKKRQLKYWREIAYKAELRWTELKCSKSSWTDHNKGKSLLTLDLLWINGKFQWQSLKQ